MAAMFVAVASYAVAAPLNAAYRADEFDFYLGDLDAKALIILGGPDAPAREVAAKRGIRVIDVTTDLSGPAGALTLSVPFADHGAPAPSPAEEAIANAGLTVQGLPIYKPPLQGQDFVFAATREQEEPDSRDRGLRLLVLRLCRERHAQAGEFVPS